MNEPLFTVVIPLYNKEDYIVKSVQSVLEQTYRNFELLIVDDGSTDTSLTRLKNISDPRFRILQKANGGVSSARNFGIRQGKGHYVAFLDADDEYEADFLKEIALLLARFPEVSAAATAYFIKHGTQKTKSFMPADLPVKGTVVKEFFKNWTTGAFFFTSSIVVEREYFYNNDKWFPEGEYMGEDQEIWFHLAEHGSIAYIGKCLSNYNIGVENSLTKSNKLTDELPFVTRLRARTKGSPEELYKLMFLQKYDLERAINNALIGNKKLACSLLNKYGYALTFLRLKAILLILLISPMFLINTARKLKRYYY